MGEAGLRQKAASSNDHKVIRSKHFVLIYLISVMQENLSSKRRNVHKFVNSQFYWGEFSLQAPGFLGFAWLWKTGLLMTESWRKICAGLMQARAVLRESDFLFGSSTLMIFADPVTGLWPHWLSLGHSAAMPDCGIISTFVHILTTQR